MKRLYLSFHSLIDWYELIFDYNSSEDTSNSYKNPHFSMKIGSIFNDIGILFWHFKKFQCMYWYNCSFEKKNQPKRKGHFGSKKWIFFVQNNVGPAKMKVWLFSSILEVRQWIWKRFGSIFENILCQSMISLNFLKMIRNTP